MDFLGSAVGSWLVSSTPDRAVWVRALAGDIVLCSWARHLTPTVPPSTQVHKWVPANLMLGVTLRWTSIPSRGLNSDNLTYKCDMTQLAISNFHPDFPFILRSANISRTGWILTIWPTNVICPNLLYPTFTPFFHLFCDRRIFQEKRGKFWQSDLQMWYVPTCYTQCSPRFSIYFVIHKYFKKNGVNSDNLTYKCDMSQLAIPNVHPDFPFILRSANISRKKGNFWQSSLQMQYIHFHSDFPFFVAEFK